MSGYEWLAEPRLLHWDDALQCELGWVAAMLAMSDYVRSGGAGIHDPADRLASAG